MQAKSLDDRGCVGYLLDIDIWQSGTTRIMQDGVVIKGLAPRRLDPARYHRNPGTDLNELVASMMHSSMRSPVLRDKPDVTSPSDFPDSERRKEVRPRYVQVEKECS